MSNPDQTSDVERDRGQGPVVPAPHALGPAERRHPFDPSYASRRCVCGQANHHPTHKEGTPMVLTDEQWDRKLREAEDHLEHAEQIVAEIHRDWDTDTARLIKARS